MNKPRPPQPQLESELLLLPDGRVLVHNLTPTMAALLGEFEPANQTMKTRATAAAAPDRVECGELTPVFHAGTEQGSASSMKSAVEPAHSKPIHRRVPGTT